MRGLLRFSVNYPWVIVGAAVSISLVLAFFVPRVQLRLDARSLVPAGHSDLAVSDAAATLFDLHDLVVIGVRSTNSGIYNSETLARIDRLGKTLASMKGVVPSSVSSITTAPRLFVRDSQFDVRPLTVTGTDLNGDKEQVIRRNIEFLGLNDGVLVSPDGRMALIVAEIKRDADRYLLLDEVKKLTSTETTGGDSISLSGTALAQATLGQASARDLMYLVPLVILVLGAALTLAFRNPIPALISLAEIAVSLLWTTSLMGVTGRSIFVTTLVMPVILISVGVSDDVYVLKRYFNEARGVIDRKQVERIFGSLIWPVTLTTISTTVGLLSLAITNLEPLIVFGVFGSMAILLSTLFTFSLVPALLVLLSPRGSRVENSTKSFGKRIALLVFRTLLTAGPYRILAITFLIAVCALVLTTRVVVDDSWIRNLPPTSEIANGDKAINELLAGSTTLDLMVDGGHGHGFFQPSAVMHLIALEERLTDLPYVGATYGIHHEILRLNASLRGMTYSAYRDSLLRGETKLTSAEIEQALMLLTVAQRAPLTTRIDESYRYARLTVFIRSADYKRIDHVLRAAIGPKDSPLSYAGVITPFGDAWISYTTVRLLVQGQARSIILALITDLILLTLLFKSVRLAMTAIIPVAFGVLFVFGVLAATQIPLGIANSMFASISIGIGLDFAIHLTAAYRRQLAHGLSRREAVKQALVGTTPSIITSSVAIATGFSVLALSQIRPNAQLGLIICLSLILCAITTLILVPTMVLSRSSRDDNDLVLSQRESAL